MRASIIISIYTLERLSDLKEALNSIFSKKTWDFEVLLVAENDTQLINGLKSAFKDQSVKIIASKESGLTSARNIGIRESSGEIIVFLDDDAVPCENWLDLLLEPYDDPEILAVGGGIVPDWTGSRPKWFPEELNWIVGSYYEGHAKEKSLVRNVIGANMSFQRKVFSEIGFFDTDIGWNAALKKKLAGDESELCMRLRQHYGPNHVLFLPAAEVRHKIPRERQTLSYCFKRAYVEGLSKATISKNFRRKHSARETQLDTEYTHLRYLATSGLLSKLCPSRMRVGEFVALLSCTFLVFLGFARGQFLK